MSKVFMNEWTYAFVMAQVALLNCRVAGMQAENQHRLIHNNGVAFGEAEFAAVEREFESRLRAAGAEVKP